MVPGQKLKENIINNRKSLTGCAKVLEMHIQDLQDLFLIDLDDEYYDQLCEKLGLYYIVPYGICQKALDQYNDVLYYNNRLVKNTERLIEEADRIDKENMELKNYVKNLNATIARLEEKLKYQLEANVELEAENKKLKSKCR